MKLIIYSLLLIVVLVVDSTTTLQSSSSSPIISQSCQNDLDLLQKLKYPNSIELIMFSGKGVNEMGNIDMCLSLPSNNSQYCVIQVNPENLFVRGSIGLCLPPSCSESDVGIAFDQLIHLAPIEINITDQIVHCYSGDNQTFKPMTTGSIVMISICSLFGLFIAIGTIIEYFIIISQPKLLKRNQINNNNEDEINQESIPLLNHNQNYYNNNHIEERSKKIKILTTFSIINNYQSFFIGQSKKRHFDVLDGVRTLSTCWVIMGHALLFITSLGYDNTIYVFTQLRKTVPFQVLAAGEFAVDVFFMLSGFLVVHALLGQFDRDRSLVSRPIFWLKYLVHRFVRLSPLYFFMLFVFWKLSPQFGSGPLWFQYQALADTCDQNWWSNLLYINTLYPTTMLGNECFVWGWYLGDDMIFYIFVAPITTIAFVKSRKLGAIAIMFWIALTFVSNMWASLHFDLATFFEFSIASTPNNFWADIYQKPWARCGAYAVGIAMAFINQDQLIMSRIRDSPYILVVSYVVAIALTSFFVFIPYTYFRNEWSTLSNALFNATAHTGFVIGAAFFLLEAFVGNGGVVSWFLERPIFRYFSKLTYSAYLIHPIVIWGIVFSHTVMFHFDFINFIMFTIGSLAITFLFSFIIHITIEKPFTNIERLLFHKQ